VSDCIFCDIVEKREPASIVFEDTEVMALLDINPLQRGHTLVIPKHHFVNIWDIDPEVLAKIDAVAQRVARKMTSVLGADGVNTFSANGKPAGQEIYHYHLHLIPLGKGERTKFGEWWKSKARRAERPELDEMAKRLRV
jgi:histidine triad (HIT) family protein